MIQLTYQGAEMQIDTHGGEMRAFRTADGRDRLWSSNPEIWKGVAPVLFPAIGGLKDNQASIDGVVYPIPRHGFARDQEFEVTEQGEDFITLTLHENAETKKVYPFDFALSVTYRFLPDGFEARFTVENHSSRTMPFLIGGHPAFACPMKEGERFEDYVVRFAKPEKGETTRCAGPGHTLTDTEPVDLGPDGRTFRLEKAEFERLDTYIFPGLNSRSVDLVHKDTGKGIRFSFDMEVLAIWTMPKKHGVYLCLEPWQGCPAYANETGRFEDKPYHVDLGVGRAYTCGYKMQTLD